MNLKICMILILGALPTGLGGCESAEDSAGQDASVRRYTVCLNEYGNVQDGATENLNGVAFTHRFAEATDVCWHFATAGEGQSIVFLHGLPESWYSWHHQLEDLARHYEVIAPDLKGYGQSGKPDGDYGLEALGEEFIDFFDALGLDRFHIVSHDWGTGIADVICGKYPNRILSYVRMEAPVLVQDIRDRPQFILFKNQRLATTLMSYADAFVRYVYDRMTIQPVAETDLGRIILEFGREGVAEAVPRYFRDMDIEAGFSGELLERRKALFAAMDFPVLPLQADSDPNQPRWYFEDATEAFPNAVLQWVEDSGHFSELEQPEAVTATIRGFLAQAAVD